MKRLLIFILLLALLAGFCGCKARTKQEKPRKGARENVVVSENPRLDEPVKETKKADEEESEPEQDPMPEKRVEGLFEAAKTGKRDEIQVFADYDSLFMLQEGQNAEWLFKQILGHMQWELLSSKVEGDKAVVSVKLTNVDMAIVLPLYFQGAGELEYNNVFADEPLGEVELELKYIELFSSLMEKHKNGKIEKLVDVNLQKFGDDWTIKPDEALSDGMCGGYFAARRSFTGGSMQFTPPEQAALTERPSPTGDGGGVFDGDVLP